MNVVTLTLSPVSPLAARHNASAMHSQDWPIVADILASARSFPSLDAIATFCLLLAADTDSNDESGQLLAVAEGIEAAGYFSRDDLQWTHMLLRALEADGRVSKLRYYFYNDLRTLMAVLNEFHPAAWDLAAHELHAEGH